MKFLMERNKTCNAIRDLIILMNPSSNVVKAYSSIVQERKQRSLDAALEGGSKDPGNNHSKGY